uniref:NBS-LRR disease resistance protein n=1 Tax=Dasypyrum villosum TaxID=40247 RepID=A0A8K1IB15_9POAL|nr:NBS-LRR disease resistance protein [Dasypyrum villosum]
METVGISAASWVVSKALSPLSEGVLEAWGASSMLGSNMGDLKLQLLEAQAMLHDVRGMEIHNPALAQMLDMLRQLAYEADDVLDELDYFRIQDELEGTYHAADAHAAGCVQDLALHARHTARACVNKLKFPTCSRAARRDDDNSSKQGFLRGLHFCGGRHEIGSSSTSPANQTKVARNVDKHFSCFSFLPSADHDAPSSVVENPYTTGENEPLQAPKLKFDRVQMSRKMLDIIEQLKPVCAKVSKVLSQLQKSSHNHAQDIAMNRPETTPQIIEPKLYGRDKHKKIVIDEIANGEFLELTVLPIVGPGGIGKTTFTQHVYEEMKSHFDVPVWICVSFDFSSHRLAKDIVDKIPKVNNENNNCSAEELIMQRIRGKRVLLILDDVWTHHENEWKKLLYLFKKEVAKGSMVIVTTRILQVANTVKTTECPLKLESLCPEDIRSFFEECVFGDQKPWADQPELFEVGSKIVDKLKGSPLAAKTVGRLLRTTLTLSHWRSVLESKEWELESDVNDIMPALKLSYGHLPFHLQQCFSFCGLFPEDYEFGSEELVHFWIGLDILHSRDQKRKRLEDVGLCYLTDLVNHGFFKMNKKEDGRPYYVIHDLLHELAVKVSSYECLSIYSSSVIRRIQIPSCVRHLSITIDNTDVKDRMSFEDCDGNLSALHKQMKVEHLRTLMLFGDYHGSFAKTLGGLFKEATALRVIFLSKASYNLEDILHNFSKLVHLRYLRIQSGYVWHLRLPNALVRLYHLTVIDLQNVVNCVFSTTHMRNLAKLRHFLVPKEYLQFHSDIYGVGKLKFLQELREFRVGKESDGFELSQLGSLTEIGGSLGIYNLENVQTKEEANESKLMHKSHLRELILEWDVGQSNSNKDPVKEENVLGSLVPHSNLQELCIRGHGGISCPSWLCANLSVKCLESLCLDGVSWKNLPPLEEMWMVNEHGEEWQCCSISAPGFYNLKRLELSNISRLKRWVGNVACPFFSHLEVLTIRHCSELIELPFSHSPTCCEAQREEKMAWFPRLEKLVIADCPKLESLPPIPWRTHPPCSADIKQVGSVESLLYRYFDESGLILSIEGKGGRDDVFWSGLNFSNLTDLEELCMKKFPPLPLDDFQLLTSLKKIEIEGVTSSVLPPVEGDRCHGVYRFPVEEVEITSCETIWKELTLLLSFFPNLSRLYITECENITGLGVADYAETVAGGQEQQTRVGEEDIITEAAAGEGLLLLPPHLQNLSILWCPNVSLLPNPSHNNHAEEGRGGGLQRLRSLHHLYVAHCPEFLSSCRSSSSSSFFLFPDCLQYLTLSGVKHMETLQALSNLTSLAQLQLDILRDSRVEGLWPLLAHGRLRNLTLRTWSGCFATSDTSPSWPHDKEVFPPSFNLVLSMESKTGFLAGPICSLLSSALTKLELSFAPEVERLTEEQEEALQRLTSLKELKFMSGITSQLQRLPAGLHNLINLKELTINNCPAIRSLPSLPSSLQVLQIEFSQAIKSLPNSLPNSLEKLKILYCEAIKSLPKNGLPSSMLELDVHSGTSEELKRACRKFIGTIPIVRT